jgi:hypothetical protein
MSSKKMRNSKSIGKSQKNKSKRVYSKKEYNSGDGMVTATWGPSMWHYLHTMSFNYPVEPSASDKKHYKDFIVNLQYVLPCKYCRMNLTKNLKQLPITEEVMKTRSSFSRYVYDLHELINTLLNKRSNLTYSEVRETYEHFRSRCTDDMPKLFNDVDIKNIDSKKETKEKGCTEPLYGKKSKCVIKIVPQDKKIKTFQVDKKCIKTRKINR